MILVPSTITPLTAPWFEWEVETHCHIWLPDEVCRAKITGTCLPDCHRPPPTYNLSASLGSYKHGYTIEYEDNHFFHKLSQATQFCFDVYNSYLEHIFITCATVIAKLSSDVPKVFVQTVAPSLLTRLTTIYHQNKNCAYVIIFINETHIFISYLSCYRSACCPTHAYPASSIRKP